jgi:hypothetical protein
MFTFGYLAESFGKASYNLTLYIEMAYEKTVKSLEIDFWLC